jgi:L-fuculose-phosphate aldolase
VAGGASAIRDLPPDVAREAHDYRLKPRPIAATFAYFARAVLRAGGADALT